MKMFQKPISLSKGFGTILLMGASTAIAGVNTWTSIGPPIIPEASAVAIDPVMTSVFYAPPWRSVDGGTTWELTNLGTNCLFLVVAAGPSGTAYAGTGCGLTFPPLTGLIFKSTDVGSTWTEVSNFPSCAVVQILVDPIVPTTVFARTDCRDPFSENLMKSLDGGHTWTHIGQELTNLTQQYQGSLDDLVMDPSNHEILFIQSPIGLFRSTDGGNTFSFFSPGAYALAVDPRNPLIMYGRTAAATSVFCCAVSKSIDGGRTFVPTSLDPLVAFRVFHIVVNPKTGDAYAAANGDKYDFGGVFETDSGGTCWREMAASPGTVEEQVNTNSLAVDPAGNFLLASVSLPHPVAKYEFAPGFEPICVGRPRPQPRFVAPRR
jgi:photosystem II stability/assembly factor-like uncharacterized protein